ncbi:MAG: DNA-3-methyladenine glycosylase 2 family protein [Verrucomicrobiales bacterium]|nr:DNA-3-methyladenine glycosylase 2 family protein [Verrucomicrobiales bacterium]
MNSEALCHLRRADPVLGTVIRRVGNCLLAPDTKRSPFESLVRAVANQQLNGKAAQTILNRFCDLFPGKRFPSSADIEAITDDQMRACGFSRAKIASIRDIARHSMSGLIPTSRQITKLPDDEIVTRLTEVRGVGRWTVEMLLMFQLGRPDVLPADDFGIRNGFRLAFGLDEMPKPKEVLSHGERWRPYRTTASWYLWRAVEIPWPAPGSPRG